MIVGKQIGKIADETELLGGLVIEIYLQAARMDLGLFSGGISRSFNPGLVETVDVEEERLLEQRDLIAGLIELAQVIQYAGVNGMVMPGCIVVGGIHNQSAKIGITLEAIGAIVGYIEGRVLGRLQNQTAKDRPI